MCGYFVLATFACYFGLLLSFLQRRSTAVGGLPGGGPLAKETLGAFGLEGWSSRGDASRLERSSRASSLQGAVTCMTAHLFRGGDRQTKSFGAFGTFGAFACPCLAAFERVARLGCFACFQRFS